MIFDGIERRQPTTFFSFFDWNGRKPTTFIVYIYVLNINPSRIKIVSWPNRLKPKPKPKPIIQKFFIKNS